MTHGTQASTITVRDPKTGKSVTVRGVGALRGALTIKNGVDLTRPIASQVLEAKPTKGRGKPAKAA